MSNDYNPPSVTGPYDSTSGASPAYRNGNTRMVDRIDNDIYNSNNNVPSLKHKSIDVDYTSDMEQPRMRRFSTTGLTDKDDKMLSNLLEKLEHVSGSLPVCKQYTYNVMVHQYNHMY